MQRERCRAVLATASAYLHLDAQQALNHESSWLVERTHDIVVRMKQVQNLGSCPGEGSSGPGDEIGAISGGGPSMHVLGVVLPHNQWKKQCATIAEDGGIGSSIISICG